MKKHFSVLSDRTCTECGKKLKQNVIDRKPKADLCFVHFILTKTPHLRWKRLHIKFLKTEVQL